MEVNRVPLRTLLGELTMLPRPPSRLGRGYLLTWPPNSPPRSSPSASGTRRGAGSQAALNTKSWLRQCVFELAFVSSTRAAVGMEICNCIVWEWDWEYRPKYGGFRGSVGIGILWGFPQDFSVGMGWVWGLKSNPHASPE